MSSGELEEAQLESSLRRLPGVSRTNVVATLSPKGGWGNTTSTFLAGNVLASHLRLRALADDPNPGSGTLADLAPDRARAPLSLVGLLPDKGADRLARCDLRRRARRPPRPRLPCAPAGLLDARASTRTPLTGGHRRAILFVR